MTGYRVRNRPHHPKATASGCVYDHVLVAEQALGRYLPDGAEIHHVNEDHRDNSNVNLVICQDKAYHKLLHVRSRIVAAGGNPNTHKICGRCRQLKPLDQFNRMKQDKAYGLGHRCRACTDSGWHRLGKSVIPDPELR